MSLPEPDENLKKLSKKQLIARIEKADSFVRAACNCKDCLGIDCPRWVTMQILSGRPIEVCDCCGDLARELIDDYCERCNDQARLFEDQEF